MSDVRENLKYTPEHEWVEVQSDGTAVIGITDYAQESLGELVYIELPEKGHSVDVGDHFAVVESVKAASEVYAPVSGEIVDVNEDLADHPETVNEAPFGDGWLVKIKLAEPSDLDDTMDEASYRTYTQSLD